MPKKIEISHKTIIFTTILILSLGLLFILKDLILELFVALLVMAILEPLVLALSKRKVPRVISVLVSYIFVLGIFISVFSLIIPAVVDQTSSFITAFPNYLKNIGLTTQISNNLIQGLLNNNVGAAPGAIFQFTFSLLNNIISIVTVFVFAFYMLISRDKLEDQLGIFFGESKKKELGAVIDTVEKRLGAWARGELILMLSVGTALYIGLSILGIPYALPIAVLGGILEIVPVLGPIISAVPSVIIGFGISPLTGVGAAALAFLIQQMENYALVPKVMQKSTGVSPLVTLIALAVGVRLAGIVGAIISVPVVITLQVVIRHYFIKD